MGYWHETEHSTLAGFCISHFSLHPLHRQFQSVLIQFLKLPFPSSLPFPPYFSFLSIYFRFFSLSFLVFSFSTSLCFLFLSLYSLSSLSFCFQGRWDLKFILIEGIFVDIINNRFCSAQVRSVFRSLSGSCLQNPENRRGQSGEQKRRPRPGLDRVCRGPRQSGL